MAENKKEDTHLGALLNLEEDLIDLIQGTSHAGALDYLTKALCELRKAHYYLDGKDFRGPRITSAFD